MGLRAKNGKWWYRVFIGGREVESGTTGLAATVSNRRQALKVHNERRAEILKERAGPKLDARRFNDAAVQFLRWCELVEYRSKPNTARRLKTSFVSLVRFFGDQLVSLIDAAAVEDYKAHRATVNQVRDITIRHDLHALSLFFKHARKNRWCSSNPVDEVKKPSDRDAIRIQVISREEERAYFKAASGNLYDVARLMLLQGCRPEEIMGLPQSSVDLKARRLTIAGGKTRAARRTLDLCTESVRILAKRMKTAGAWIFPSDKKRGQHIVTLQTSHDRVCREAGVSFNLYALRHTFATRLGDAGVPITTIAALLGHSGLRMVMRYCHPSAEAKKDAMRRYEEMLKQPRLRVVG